MYRCVLLASLVTACQPFLAAGYDATSRVHGPLSSVLDQQVTLPGTAASVAPGASATTAAAPRQAATYGVTIGAGSRDFTVELPIRFHDVTGANFSIPGPPVAGEDAPKYLLSSAVAQTRFTWLRIANLSTDLHAGQAGAMLLDRTTGERQFALGFSYGAGFALTLRPIVVSLDFYRTGFRFTTGPATGFSAMTGVTVGLALR
jgi:hypothetical protein